MIMKKLTKKMIATIMVFLLTITAIPVGTMNTQAASPKINKKLEFRYYEGLNGTATCYIYIQNPTKNGKITKIKNSNSEVAKLGVYNKNVLTVQPKTVGTSKVSFMYAGKKFKTTITVKKWENPCKQFKIGNVDYAKKFEKTEQYNLNNRKTNQTAKISVKPKKGWKLLKIATIDMERGYKKVKNNSKIKLLTKYTGTGVYAYFKNTKTGERERIYFGYSGQKAASENIYNTYINPNDPYMY